LYAHPSIDAEPMSGGRQMGGHFMTHSLDENGDFKNLTEQYNSTVIFLLQLVKCLAY